MKVKLRQATWAFALAITLTAFGTPNFAGAFQSAEGLEHGGGYDKDGDRDWATNYTRNPNYQWRMNDGRANDANNGDRRNPLRMINDTDRRVYKAGYDQGYQSNSRRGYDHGRDNNGNYNGQNGRYDQNGQYARNGDLAAPMAEQWTIPVLAPRTFDGGPLGIGVSQDQNLADHRRGFRKSVLWILQGFSMDTSSPSCSSVNVVLGRPVC